MDIYASVTDTIIKAIEQNPTKPVMPWHRTSGGMPKNGTTGAEYKGVNILMLWACAAINAYPSSEWASYKQWQEKGRQVKKGSKSSIIVFYKQLPKDEETDERKAVLRYSLVFNASQLEDFTPPPPTQGDIDRLAHAEAAIKATGAKITERGDKACYVPAMDEVFLPESWRFFDTETSTRTESYYSVLFHELTHWTGHKDRLNRELKNRFGDPKYAFEELVAELGAAYCCARLNITPQVREDHASYLANWLQVLRDDKRAIFNAAALAQKAVDFLL